MKFKIIGTYLLIALLCGFCFWAFGNYGYKSFAYNLGRGLIWPVNIFENTTKIDSSNDISFAQTYNKVQTEHKNYEGVYLFNEAVGKIMMNMYAKNNENFTYEDYKEVMKGSSSGYASASNMVASLFDNDRQLVKEFREKVDGMKLIDVIDAGEKADKETKKILSVRKVETSIIDSCVDSRVRAFRSEAGQEAMIRHDMLSEWKSECSA